jgi:hypothetical protein
LGAVLIAVQFILRGEVIRHRRWMMRSYALTAAITLRMYLPLIFLFHWPFSIAYPAIAWLCWIPNALAVEVYLRFLPTPSRITLQAKGRQFPLASLASVVGAAQVPCAEDSK